MGAGRRLLCFSIFIIITKKKKWKDAVSLSLEMMPFSPCFSPQSPSCLCSIMPLCWLSFQAFHTLLSFLRKKKRKAATTKRNRSLIKNRRGGRFSFKNLISQRVFFMLFIYLFIFYLRCWSWGSLLKSKRFNGVGPGSEHKCRKSGICLPSLSHSSVMTDKKAAVNL